MPPRKRLTPWSCPKCGTPNSKVKDVCGMCGLLRPNEDDAPAADAPKPIASQTTLQTRIPGICTHCYGDLELPVHPPGFCFYCNHRKPSEEEREQFFRDPPVLPCVECEADVKGLKFCSGCGSKVPDLKTIFAAARNRVLRHRDQFYKSEREKEDYSRYALDGAVSEVIAVEKQVCGACGATVQPSDLRCGGCNAKLRSEVSRVIREAGVEEHELQLRAQGQQLQVVSEAEAQARLADAGVGAEAGKGGPAASPQQPPSKPAVASHQPRPKPQPQPQPQPQRQQEPGKVLNMFKRMELEAKAGSPAQPLRQQQQQQQERPSVVAATSPASPASKPGQVVEEHVEERINADGKRVRVIKRVVRRVVAKKDE